MASELTPAARAATRNLILILADSKRLLGMRYADWILGAPELEAGIACASMAQDEWGHGRLLYALLKDFDEDVERLEHGREPAEYVSIEVLDREPATWPNVVALNALVDGALSVQLEAFLDSSWVPLRQRVEKLLEEERFHAAHGRAWLRRLSRGGESSRLAMKQAAEEVLPGVTRWFGPDSDLARATVAGGVTNAAGTQLRDRFYERLGPLLDELGVRTADTPSFQDFDETTRRVGRDGPDAGTIAQVRGDKNRAFLMD